MAALTRRRLLAASVPAMGLGATLLYRDGATAATTEAVAAGGGHAQGHGGQAARAAAAGDGHAAFRGQVDHEANGFHPTEILRDFDYGTTTRMAGGRVLREWQVVAEDHEIEVMPGVKFPAWTYNGRIPGPTFRGREGELLRVTFINGSSHPHTMHFHGLHPASMDGVPGLGAGTIEPGGRTTYEFEARPFGLHLYHCHVRPLAEHIAKGLYGAFIIDPKEERAEADELVMVMNAFDTNFDAANEVYAANTIGFAYMDEPIEVRCNELVRIYLVNVLEYDLINSFHLHGNFFDWYPTGTRREPSELTDTVMLCQGQRGIAEVTFPTPGRFMFHAHQSEFTELGWQGFFDVREDRARRALCELPDASGAAG